MFRVVPDQLRVSEGWVRCGRCAAVFDATQNMLESAQGGATAPTSGTPVTTASGPYANTSGATHAAPAKPVPQAPTAPQAAPAPTAPTAPQAPTVTPAGTATPAHGLQSAGALSTWNEADDDHDDWLDIPLTDPKTVILQTQEGDEPPATGAAPVMPVPWVAPATPTPEPVTPMTTAATPTPQAGPTASAATLVIASPADEVRREPEAAPSFLRHEDPPTSLWRRPATRAVLLVVLLALLLALGAQILLKERNRVAASAPALRPALHALCALAGCSVTPLRRIEAIVIDSSSFSRLRDDSYHLGFALRNTAAVDVAMPALELSLTDPQDQPVIRRVILPAEFGARTPALERDGLWNGSLAFTVQAADATRRIVGYRLLAFYP